LALVGESPLHPEYFVKISVEAALKSCLAAYCGANTVKYDVQSSKNHVVGTAPSVHWKENLAVLFP
jgi:hypothetical protein